jgi:plastocyanin
LTSAIPTIPAVTSRSFETAVQLAVDHANATGVETLLVFDHVFVEVMPGDTVTRAAENFLAAETLVVARLGNRPLLSEPGRLVKPGDIVETMTDDHYTHIVTGSFGLVTNVRVENDRAHTITVRFSRRTVDFGHEDFQTLRYVC